MVDIRSTRGFEVPKFLYIYCTGLLLKSFPSDNFVLRLLLEDSQDNFLNHTIHIHQHHLVIYHL